MLALLLLACSSSTDATAVDSTSSADPAEDGWAVSPTIDTVGFSCQGADWRFSLLTEGWIGSAELRVAGTSEELHPFPVVPVAYDPYGAWDRYALDLAYGEYVAGQASAWPCIDPPGQGLAFRVAIFDRDGVERDCKLWGTRPEESLPACE